jgi:hypothetical protein
VRTKRQCETGECVAANYKPDVEVHVNSMVNVQQKSNVTFLYYMKYFSLSHHACPSYCVDC